MNHLFPDRGTNPHAVSVRILFHQFPIRDERIVKGDDIDVSEISNVVTTSKIGRLFWFAASDTRLRLRDREADAQGLEGWLGASYLARQDLLRSKFRRYRGLLQFNKVWHGQSS